MPIDSQGEPTFGRGKEPRLEPFLQTYPTTHEAITAWKHAVEQHRAQSSRTPGRSPHSSCSPRVSARVHLRGQTSAAQTEGVRAKAAADKLASKIGLWETKRDGGADGALPALGSKGAPKTKLFGPAPGLRQDRASSAEMLKCTGREGAEGSIRPSGRTDGVLSTEIMLNEQLVDEESIPKSFAAAAFLAPDVLTAIEPARSRLARTGTQPQAEIEVAAAESPASGGPQSESDRAESQKTARPTAAILHKAATVKLGKPTSDPPSAADPAAVASAVAPACSDAFAGRDLPPAEAASSEAGDAHANVTEAAAQSQAAKRSRPIDAEDFIFSIFPKAREM
eukprot:5905382-Pleurochrysis_carterae.AAC.2